MIQQYIREPNEQRYLPTNPNVKRLNIRKLPFFRKALRGTNLSIDVILGGYSRYRQLYRSSTTVRTMPCAQYLVVYINTPTVFGPNFCRLHQKIQNLRKNEIFSSNALNTPTHPVLRNSKSSWGGGVWNESDGN